MMDSPGGNPYTIGMRTRWTWPIFLLGAAAVLMIGCPPRGNAHLPEATPAMASFAQTRWPDATIEQLARGRATMGARCAECHGLAAPTAEPAHEWPGIMKRMAKKAKLEDAQREDILRYVLAAREAR